MTSRWSYVILAYFTMEIPAIASRSRRGKLQMSFSVLIELNSRFIILIHAYPPLLSVSSFSFPKK